MVVQNFNYSNQDDQEIFIQAVISIGNKSLTVSACTSAGSKDGVIRKKNEDAFSVLEIDKNLVLAVFDGSSSQKPILTLGDVSGARFASHFLRSEFEKNESESNPRKILSNLNRTLWKKVSMFKGTSLEDVLTLPATTATIGRIDVKNNRLDISDIGDSFCILEFKSGELKCVTIDRNKMFDDKYLELLKQISVENQITPREARADDRCRQKIIKMYQDTYNKPDGSGQGIVNGNPDAELYMQEISFPLDSIKTIFIGSDGIVPPGFDEHLFETQKILTDIIKSGGLEALIDFKRKTEDGDPNWEIVRDKHSDDATGIFIRL